MQPGRRFSSMSRRACAEFGHVTRLDGHRLRYNCRDSVINGDFLAQNSTYTSIDKVVAAPGGLLSTAALVPLKVNGDASDEFSFAFETLEAQ